MQRAEFIKSCGLACLGAVTLSPFLQSCAGTKIITAQIAGDNIMVPLIEFEEIKKEKKSIRKYIVVQNDSLQFPIAVYRLSEKEYTALYMKCSHQGNEVTPYGDKLHCSGHGSEFDKNGKVTNGPAEKSLRTFPVLIDNEYLKISLKAV
ncbi:MAG: Rieske (2Fe-2S) protein [Bacteroidota bacterium]